MELLQCPHDSQALLLRSCMVILGDFNVHYGSSGDNDACMLADILHSTNFQKHVSSATQCRIYSVADVAYATGPALLGAPRFYLDLFTRVKKKN